MRITGFAGFFLPLAKIYWIVWTMLKAA